MDFDHDKVGLALALTEDRLSKLPDELIHQILSCLDTKFAVQTCILSPRWKFIWKSVPCLNFSATHFCSLPNFAKFVNHVLSNRNHQIEVPLVKLHFHGSANQDFVTNISNYAVSHNVQNLTMRSGDTHRHEFPSCLVSSHSLKHLTFCSYYLASRVIPVKPWDFPSLTTLHLSNIKFGEENISGTFDIFSKCVNLKNLTLKDFVVEPAVEVFDIITPQLTHLILENGNCSSTAVNVIAPKLENLTVISCSIKYLNVPPAILSFCYKGYDPQGPPQMPDYSFHSLNNVILHFYISDPKGPYGEHVARATINMLEKLHSAKFLTLNLDIVECLSSFPDLVSQTPSPFSNLISVSIDSNRKEPYKVKISSETRNFFLENSPNATFITDLPEEPPTKEMLAEQAREKRMAKLYADIASQMTELQELLLNQENRVVERKEAKEKTKIALENLVAEVHVWEKKLIMQTEPERAQTEEVLARIEAQFKARLGDMQNLIKQENYAVAAIDSNKDQVKALLRRLNKQRRAEMETQYSQQLQQTETMSLRLASETLFSDRIINSFNVLVFKNAFSLASQPSSSAIEPPTKEMIGDKKNGGMFADIASSITKLQALLVDKETKNVEIKQEELKTKIALHNLVGELQEWKHKLLISPNKAEIEEFVGGLEAQFKICVGEMFHLINQKHNDVEAIDSEKWEMELLFDKLKTQYRKEIEAHYSHHLQQVETLCDHFKSEASSSRKIIDAFEKVVFHNISELKNISNSSSCSSL